MKKIDKSSIPSHIAIIMDGNESLRASFLEENLTYEK